MLSKIAWKLGGTVFTNSYHKHGECNVNKNASKKHHQWTKLYLWLKKRAEQSRQYGEQEDELGVDILPSLRRMMMIMKLSIA